MLRPRSLAPLGAALLLAACATATPPLMALPGKDKKLADFQQDEASCRQFAAQAAYPKPGSAAPAPVVQGSAGTVAAWQRYDAGYAQCMTSRGDVVQPVPYPSAYAYAYPAYGYYYGDPFFYPGFYDGFYDGIGLYGFGFGYGYGFGHGGFAYYGPRGGAFAHGFGFHSGGRR